MSKNHKPDTETEVLKLQALVKKLELKNQYLRNQQNPYDSDSLDSSISGVSQHTLVSESDDTVTSKSFKPVSKNKRKTYIVPDLTSIADESTRSTEKSKINDNALTTPSPIYTSQNAAQDKPELIMFCESESHEDDTNKSFSKSLPSPIYKEIMNTPTVASSKEKDKIKIKIKDKLKLATGFSNSNFEEDTWLFRYSKKETIEKNTLLSPIKWMREVFDNPSEDIMKAKIILRTRLEEIERFGRLRAASISHPSLSTIGLSTPMVIGAASTLNSYPSNPLLFSSIGSTENFAKSRQYQSTGSQTNLIGIDSEPSVPNKSQSRERLPDSNLNRTFSEKLGGSQDLTDVRLIAKMQEENLKAQVNNLRRQSSTDKINLISGVGDSYSRLVQQQTVDSSGSDVELATNSDTTRYVETRRHNPNQVALRPRPVSGNPSETKFGRSQITNSDNRQRPVSGEYLDRLSNGHQQQLSNQFRSRSSQNINHDNRVGTVQRVRSFTSTQQVIRNNVNANEMKRSNSGDELNRTRRSSNVSITRPVQVHRVPDSGKPQAPPRQMRTNRMSVEAPKANSKINQSVSSKVHGAALQTNIKSTNSKAPIPSDTRQRRRSSAAVSKLSTGQINQNPPTDTDYARSRGYKSIHYYEENF